MRELRVTSVRYFETRRGLGYECKTNVKEVSVWNDGNGGGTYLRGNVHTTSGAVIGNYSRKYNGQQLESLIDEYENVKTI